MLRSRANEIPQLIRRLRSPHAARVDGARARLSVIGARAVEHLIAALEGDDGRVRERVIPLLALIHDPRGREPLIATLLDADARIRECAAESLARYPAADTQAALERLLRRDGVEAVRVAAVRALVEHYAAGREEAIRQPLALLLEPRESRRVRAAASALLLALPAGQRRCILGRLREDPDEDLRRRAEELEAELQEPAPASSGRIAELLRELGSPDYPTWNDAVHRLGRSGAPIVAPLVEEMRRRAHDPEFCTRAGMALKALGRRDARLVADALDRVEEPLALQVLVEVIGAFGETALIYRLKGLIDRLAARAAASSDPETIDPLRRVRAKAHLELARIGSRVAIQDLRETLGDASQRVELEMLAAVARNGKRDELVPLLRAWQREEPFLQSRIADALRAIMRRERIRRDDRAFHALSDPERVALERILPRPGQRAARRAPAGRSAD